MREDTAVAGALRGIEMLNRIGKTACRSDDGNGPKTRRVHLCQPARLVTRRHEKDVAARQYAVRERLVVTAGHGDSGREAGGDFAEVALEGGGAPTAPLHTR